MLDENTPLPDVVNWLPVEVAIYLDDKPPLVQEFSVQMLKDLFLFLEARKTVLDPFQLESVLSFIAVQSVGFAETVQRMTEVAAQALGALDEETGPEDQGSEGSAALHGEEGVQECAPEPGSESGWAARLVLLLRPLRGTR